VVQLWRVDLQVPVGSDGIAFLPGASLVWMSEQHHRKQTSYQNTDHHSSDHLVYRIEVQPSKTAVCTFWAKDYRILMLACCCASVRSHMLERQEPNDRPPSMLVASIMSEIPCTIQLPDALRPEPRCRDQPRLGPEPGSHRARLGTRMQPAEDDVQPALNRQQRKQNSGVSRDFFLDPQRQEKPTKSSKKNVTLRPPINIRHWAKVGIQPSCPAAGGPG
jgi:hypothetical protein